LAHTEKNKIYNMNTSDSTGMPLSRRIYSVSEFSGALSLELANKFPSVCVRGEVTNLSKPRSGHWYFSLKDEDAQIRSVMFRGSNLKAHQIKEGDEVIACGKPGIYKDRGDLQLIVSHLQLAGAGDLQRQFEELKKQLQEQGHFDRERKKAIPNLPKKVAVITSASGAVIHDIQTITNRRAPILPLLLLPVNVQGNDAIASIIQSISIADTRPDIELILLARGGGSLEDFAAFNSLDVAQAIIRCNTPVICAVGHESDISIADLVADLRAATPSEAAEVITEGYMALNDHLGRLKKTSKQLLERLIGNIKSDLLLTNSRLKDPTQEIRQSVQRLDALDSLLESRAKLSIQRKAESLLKVSKTLNISSLSQQYSEKQSSLAVQKDRLTNAQASLLQQTQQRFLNSVQLLDAISPLSVLSRGYGITTSPEGKVISSIDQTSKNQTIQTRLEDGNIISTVVSTNGI